MAIIRESSPGGDFINILQAALSSVATACGKRVSQRSFKAIPFGWKILGVGRK